MYLNTLSLGDWSTRSLAASNRMAKSDEAVLSTRQERRDIFKEDREFLEIFLTNLNKLSSHQCGKDTDLIYLEQTFQPWNDLFKVYQKHSED